ncbi:Arrestin-like protein [Macrophomina phaseolina MS6]|uniref:Arrestin-like protein n=1 Tax=Macrophomina phaseolina (strain MS6) TaxID=1126212 RepID=K2R4J3_MACPH|nr:Arrestin-like protein [Macrophomina phaseolina MS6]
MLEFPTHRHPRVAVDIQLGAPLFVGGGSLEGNIRISIEDAERQRHKRALAIARISVDLLGIEEMWNAKRDIFMDLATELIDSENPPPENMVDTVKQLSPLDPFWLLKPSVTTMPFSISLPLDVGPPPFQSKLARIRYALCCTLLVRDKGVQYLVRTSQEVSVLSVYDPERALMSLPSPLTASDEYTRPRESSIEVTKVTAGLHRQVWVSGTCIFVDVHIANNSRKTIKKLELQLERNILCYKHTAAATLEKSAGQARIFDNNERTVFAKTSIKQGSHGWSGVPPHTTLTRTADLEVPRGHATVKCGKFFEVRYFLNIIVSSTHSKLVSVQLPIVLIHMNSLDVVPNSVAQVAAAIEEKRGNSSETRARALDRGNPRSVQGRAFAAPRMQSLDRMRSDAEDIQELGHILERSPRKYRPATKISTTINPDGSTSIQKEHIIRRVQSATPKLTGRCAGRKYSSENIGINSAVGLGYGYHSNNDLVGSDTGEHNDSNYQLTHRRHASSPGFDTPPDGNCKGRPLEMDSVESAKHHIRHVRSNETNHSFSSSATHGYVNHHAQQHAPSFGLKQSTTLPAPGSARSHSRAGSNTISSAAPLPPHLPPPPLPPLLLPSASFGPLHTGNGHNSFREAEVAFQGERDSGVVDLGTGGSGGGYPGGSGHYHAFGGMGSGAASFKARLDAARDRQWKFQGPGRENAGSRLIGGHGGNAKKWKGLPERGLEWIMGDREEREKEKEKERRRAMDNWI